MRGNLLRLLILFMAAMFICRGEAAVNKTVWGDAATREFVFVENDTDDNYFVTPAGVLDPRMTGSNRWTGLKYNGSGTIYQQSLGYIDNGYNTPLNHGWHFDMWIENSPISYPLMGLRCINWYSGCDMTTSLIPPILTDADGFYGVTVPAGGTTWMHGMMSDTFYEYLRQMPVGDNFSMTINTCQTDVNYSPGAGERCVQMSSGQWYVRKVSFTKGAHLKFLNTNSLSEVFINSDGMPTIGEGNSDCKLQVIGSRSGLVFKMLNYTLLTNGVNNTSIRIFPSVNHAALSAAIGTYDMQFSLNGQDWKGVSGTTYAYNFNDLKNSNSVYLFLSNNFFKQMVNLGISDINSRDLFNFRFRNTVALESGWYEMSTSGQLIIKPRDFSVSIISKDFSQAPYRQGLVGSGKPSLDFEYIVTTNGKTSADEVLASVAGPGQSINGRPYCIFSSSDGQTKVPFPASLSFLNQSGASVAYDVGCDDSIWHDITSALWLSTPWYDPALGSGVMNKTNLTFSINMDAPESQKTIAGDDWFGEVSASGEIRVKAIWH